MSFCNSPLWQTHRQNRLHFIPRCQHFILSAMSQECTNRVIRRTEHQIKSWLRYAENMFLTVGNFAVIGMGTLSQFCSLLTL
ncbi:hypothetical protein RO07_25145 [Pandoraea pulmonicola]|uniref:Uncharacterized protein n=1 Tax=Pandoraea pulmonicola TaxID=93221 RepID=A0ABM6FRU7_PANPU|nr:hypothetical protein RO07_25145 [Pandoraea pulmonicola]